MIPVLKKNASSRISLQAIDGGVNLKNGQSDVLDNQMTDARNVWFENGVLQTRPALEMGEEVFDELTEGQTRTVRVSDSTTVINGMRYTLVTDTVSRDNQGVRGQYISVYLMPDRENYKKINVGKIEIDDNYSGNLTSWTIQQAGDIYCYLQYDTFDAGDYKKVYEIWKFTRMEGTGNASYNAVLQEPYAPLVITNIWADLRKTDQSTMVARGATMIEGLNLVGNKYRIQGSTYDASATAAQAGTVVYSGHPAYPEEMTPTNQRYAQYPLLFEQKGLTGTVRLEYTNEDGIKIVHAVYIYPQYDDHGNLICDKFEANPRADGFYLHVGNKSVGLYTSKSHDSMAYFTPAQYVKNNMIITALCPNTNENHDKVFNMTKSIWFGGAARGIHGGSRLFLGGNTGEKEKALILWSDLNNPLYFNENCYTYVGDKSQAVTAFGRQGSALVIFKERELFYTQYEQGANINADDVTEQNVVDVVTNSAYFPVTQISGSIGCDCPDTVQLCRNRLVWLSSDKRVYELISENQYTERAAVTISDMIAPALNSQSIEDLRNAHSADWRGHYLLFIGANVYVMDYNSYGFSYAASYTKEESAEARIPWYIWELPFIPDSAFAAENLLYLFKSDRYSPGIYPHVKTCINYLTGTGDYDEFAEVEWDEDTHPTPSVEKKTQPIDTMIQTKIFDFGYPAILKRVKRVDISLGDNGGLPVRVEFISEAETEDAGEIVLTSRGAIEGSAASFCNKQIHPYTFASARFGIRLQTRGRIKLDKIMLTYSVLGGAKWR